MQNVPIRALAELHGIDFHLGCDMLREILCNNTPDYLQTNTDVEEAQGEFNLWYL